MGRLCHTHAHFGSVADVLHYNVLPSIVAALSDRFLGLPIVGYLGDFAAVIRRCLGEDALRVFTRFCNLLWISLKPGKSEVGSVLTFLGILGSFPDPPNRDQLRISLPPGKKSYGQI